MRTKQEVVFNLANNGYSTLARHKIAGFLLGINMVKKDEKLYFLAGKMEFYHFYEWFMQEEKVMKKINKKI